MIPARTQTPVQLADGSTVIMTELSQRDYFSVLKEARRTLFAELISAIPEQLPEPEKDKLRKLALEEMRELAIDSDYIWKDVNTLCFMFYLSIRKAQPTMTLEQVEQILFDSDNMERMTRAMNSELELADSVDDSSKKKEQTNSQPSE